MWEKWLKKHDETAAVKRTDIDPRRIPRHIAIIMDGNGRWAKKRGMLRTFGHRAGAETLRTIARAAAGLNVKALTVYAFSTENWKRPQTEVDFLMRLFAEYLDNEIEEMHRANMKIVFSGRTEALNKVLRDKIENTRARTAANTGLILNLAVNYGGRDEIVRAVQILAGQAARGDVDAGAITEETVGRVLYTKDLPELDLLIRPSGDLRLSNFLLWQAAYAELWFTEVNWPDFKPQHLLQAIAAFQKRDRRFGGLHHK